MRADRVLALPRGRPVSRATREVFTGLMQVCQDLVDEGKFLVAKPRKNFPLMTSSPTHKLVPY